MIYNTVMLAIFLQVVTFFVDSTAIRPVSYFYNRANERKLKCVQEWIDFSCDQDKVEVDVSFRLYQNREHGTINARDTSACPDPTQPVKVIIHGWLNNPFSSWILDIKDAYYEKGLYNVIAVDWSKFANNFGYYQAVSNAKCVGNSVGKFIVNDLYDRCSIPSENIHLIGHSLGAHISGFAGKYINKNAPYYQINRISGLDMAGPYFWSCPCEFRVCKGDAEIVDIYHTDDEMFGCIEAVGDYDFYINEGVSPQPGCPNILLYGNACSHERACKLYIESIYATNFIAKKCERNNESSSSFNYSPSVAVEIMGERLTAYSPHGTYCIITNSQPPYAMPGWKFLN